MDKTGIFNDRSAVAPRIRENGHHHGPGLVQWSAWGLSTLLHLAVFGIALLALPRAPKGLQTATPDPVGIVLKSETPTESRFEAEREVFHDPRPRGAGAEAEDPQNTPPTPPSPVLPVLPVLPELPDFGPMSQNHSASAATPPGDLPTPKDFADDWLREPTAQRQKAAQAALPALDAPGGTATSRTRFFNTEAAGKSFLFVIDRSGSMLHGRAFDRARREVLVSLSALLPESTFGVMVYSDDTQVLHDGKQLIPASRRNVEMVARRLEAVIPRGGTNHRGALTAALEFRPEVLFFLTDADSLTERDVRQIWTANRQAAPRATIHCIELGDGPKIHQDRPLRQLAEQNDGSYIYFDVLQFTRTP